MRNVDVTGEGIMNATPSKLEVAVWWVFAAIILGGAAVSFL